MLKIILKMHDLCKTKMVKNGYKDMNLFQGTYLTSVDTKKIKN